MRQTAQIRLADALESSSEGIVVLSAEGRVTLANSQAHEFFGQSFHEPGWLKTLPL
ncbi:PAS domain-containing protein, partial [Acinetobacter baumannii]